MTGTFVRIKRDHKFINVEFDQLTDDEMDEFAGQNPKDGWKWAKFFAKWIRDNLEEGEEK